MSEPGTDRLDHIHPKRNRNTILLRRIFSPKRRLLLISFLSVILLTLTRPMTAQGALRLHYSG